MMTTDNEPMYPWLDLSAYGLCVFKLDSDALNKHWIVVSGDVDQHGEALSQLGFVRSPRGVMYMPVTGTSWRPSREWKATFPNLRVREMPLSRMVVKASEPAVVRPASADQSEYAADQHSDSHANTDRGGATDVRRDEGERAQSAEGRAPGSDDLRSDPGAEQRSDGDHGGISEGQQKELKLGAIGGAFADAAAQQTQPGLKLTYQKLASAFFRGERDVVFETLSSPSNTNSRALFTQITGVALPPTERGSSAAIQSWWESNPSISADDYTWRNYRTPARARLARAVEQDALNRNAFDGLAELLEGKHADPSLVVQVVRDAARTNGTPEFVKEVDAAIRRAKRGGHITVKNLSIITDKFTYYPSWIREALHRRLEAETSGVNLARAAEPVDALADEADAPGGEAEADVGAEASVESLVADALSSQLQKQGAEIRRLQLKAAAVASAQTLEQKVFTQAGIRHAQGLLHEMRLRYFEAQDAVEGVLESGSIAAFDLYKELFPEAYALLEASVSAKRALASSVASEADVSSESVESVADSVAVSRLDESEHQVVKRITDDARLDALARHFYDMGMSTHGSTAPAFGRLSVAIRSRNHIYIADLLAHPKYAGLRDEFTKYTLLDVPSDPVAVRELALGLVGSKDYLTANISEVDGNASNAFRAQAPEFYGSENLRGLEVHGTYEREPARFVFTGVSSGPDRTWMVMAQAHGSRVSPTGFQAFSGIPVRGLLNTDELREDFVAQVMPRFEIDVSATARVREAAIRNDMLQVAAEESQGAAYDVMEQERAYLDQPVDSSYNEDRLQAEAEVVADLLADRDRERRAFEAYILFWRDNDALVRNDPAQDSVHDYVDHATQEAWEAWEERALGSGGSLEREAFEAYILRDRGVAYLERVASADPDRRYTDAFVQTAWMAWQVRAMAPPPPVPEAVGPVPSVGIPAVSGDPLQAEADRDRAQRAFDPVLFVRVSDSVDTTPGRRASAQEPTEPVPIASGAAGVSRPDIAAIRRDAVLDTKAHGESVTRRQWVESRIAAGFKPSITQEDRIKPMSSLQFFRATNEEQAAHERRVKAGGKKDVYWIGDQSATKTEYDYAVSLLKNSQTAQEASGNEPISEPATQGMRVVGQNLAGQVITEDARGVRTVNGQVETVGMRPTERGMEMVVQHRGDWLTAQEASGAAEPVSAADGPLPAVAAMSDDELLEALDVEVAPAFGAAEAQRAGAMAFAAGLGRAPALNQAFFDSASAATAYRGPALQGVEATRAQGTRAEQWSDLADAYLRGWDEANLAAPVQSTDTTAEQNRPTQANRAPELQEASGAAELVSAPVADLVPAEPETAQVVDTRPLNYRIPDELGARLLVERNADTMRRQYEIFGILQSLRDDNRPATDAERATLAGYSGWGPFAKELMDAQVRRNVGEHFAAVIESTPNAFYTPVVFIDSLWQMARKAGFTGGRVGEPGAGAGWFLGRVPEDLAERTEFVAVEKEPIAARILQELYPRATVMPVDYRVAPIPDDSFDLVIGNVPYGDEKVTDARFPDTYSLHDYFIINSLRALRPGGVFIGLTSTYTLDRYSSAARDEMYKVADLEAGFRLPMGALVKTDVCADILVFRKRLPTQEPRPYSWRFSEPNGEDGPPLNNGFSVGLVRPLGELFVHATNGPMGTRNAIRRSVGDAALSVQLVEGTPEGILTERLSTLTEMPAMEEAQPVDPQRIEGLFVLAGDGVAAIENGVPVPILVRGKALERLRAYVGVREAAREVMRHQLDQGPEADAALEVAQGVLGQAYDQFVAKFGPINQPANRRPILDDPFHDLVLALEIYDPELKKAAKTEIFTERTIVIRDTPDPETPLDALLASIDRFGVVNPEAISGWLKRPWADVRAELKGQVLDDPGTGKPELAEVYCSGNLREKLAVAQEACRINPAYNENIEALSLTLGAMKQRDSINVSLGAPWVDAKYYAAFMTEVIYAQGFNNYANFTVTRDAFTSRWNVDCDRKPPEPPDFSTENWKAKDLVEAIMNGRIPKVFHPREPEEKGPARLDEKATVLAEQKVLAINNAFAAWVWNDEARALAIEERFNNTLNAYRGLRLRDIPISLPGLSAERTPRNYQYRGISRIVLERNQLLAHEVGAGKTFTMAGAAVKLKQLGIAGKSLMAVRKSTLYPIFTDVKRFFPNLRVAMIETTDLNPAGRKAFLRRIQTQRPDLIITTHEAFRKLALPPEVEIQEVSRALAKIEAAVEGESGGKSSANVKRLGKQLANMRGKLQDLLSEDDDPKKKASRELRITLADLGVQALFVDEAQAFKNLQVVTTEPMLGIPTSFSARALDMSMKVRWLQSQNAVIVFATGTPITNSLVETYTLQRYLAPTQLRVAGLEDFDAWKSVFAKPVMKIEPDPGGKGYRAVQRLAGMKNVPVLVDMLSTFTDVVSGDDMRIKRPMAEHVTVEIEPTPLQQLFRLALAEKTMIVRTLPEQARDDRINILTVLGEARRSALDLRALYPFITDGEGGNKVGEVVSNVSAIYHETRDIRATQTIFCDLATPKAPGQRGFSVYEALKNGLVGAGVPAGEIAFIHDCRNDREKEQLFLRVKKGEIAVLLGSTEKMGEGCNIQDRLYAQHHLNAPYHPGQLIQRNGRIIRFGNMHSEVKCFYYTTKGLLEDWNWSLVNTKQRFIGQVMSALSSHGRNASAALPTEIVEDAAAVDLGEIEAAASGDPRVREKFALEAKVRELAMLMQVRKQERDGFGRKLRDVEGQIREQSLLKGAADELGQKVMEARKVRMAAGKSFEILLYTAGVAAGGKRFDVRKDAGEAIIKYVALLEERYSYVGTVQQIGMIDGLDVFVSIRPAQANELIIGPRQSPLSESKFVGKDPVGAVRSIENAVEAIALRHGRIALQLQSLEQQKEALCGALARKDDIQVQYDAASLELAKIDAALQSGNAIDVRGHIDRFHNALLERYGNDGRSVHSETDDPASSLSGVDDEDEDDDVEVSGSAAEKAFGLLTDLIPNLRERNTMRLTKAGFMDLIVEKIDIEAAADRENCEGLSLAHYYQQSGDLIPDPDMELVVDWDRKRVEPVSIAMTGIYRRASESRAEEQDQASFLVMWLRNLRAQGHQWDGKPSCSPDPDDAPSTAVQAADVASEPVAEAPEAAGGSPINEEVERSRFETYIQTLPGLHHTGEAWAAWKARSTSTVAAGASSDQERLAFEAYLPSEAYLTNASTHPELAQGVTGMFDRSPKQERIGGVIVDRGDYVWPFVREAWGAWQARAGLDQVPVSAPTDQAQLDVGFEPDADAPSVRRRRLG